MRFGDTNLFNVESWTELCFCTHVAGLSHACTSQKSNSQPSPEVVEADIPSFSGPVFTTTMVIIVTTSPRPGPGSLVDDDAVATPARGSARFVRQFAQEATRAWRGQGPGQLENLDHHCRHRLCSCRLGHVPQE